VGTLAKFGSSFRWQLQAAATERKRSHEKSRGKKRARIGERKRQLQAAATERKRSHEKSRWKKRARIGERTRQLQAAATERKRSHEKSHGKKRARPLATPQISRAAWAWKGAAGT
jgi:hypothetical protein